MGLAPPHKIPLRLAEEVDKMFEELDDYMKAGPCSHCNICEPRE